MAVCAVVYPQTYCSVGIGTTLQIVNKEHGLCGSVLARSLRYARLFDSLLCSPANRSYCILRSMLYHVSRHQPFAVLVKRNDRVIERLVQRHAARFRPENDFV
jgi:hypothetical protein